MRATPDGAVLCVAGLIWCWSGDNELCCVCYVGAGAAAWWGDSLVLGVVMTRSRAGWEKCERVARLVLVVRGDKGVVIRNSAGRGDEEKCCAGAALCWCCAVRMLILMAMLVLVLGVAVTRAW